MKAEQRALKAYPIKIAERDGYDENLRERKGFVKGYHQAEKDLKLKEIDLEEELADLLEKENAYIDDNNVISYYNGSSFNHTYDIYPIARHFFNLGLKAQKGEEV